MHCLDVAWAKPDTSSMFNKDLLTSCAKNYTWYVPFFFAVASPFSYALLACYNSSLMIHYSCNFCEDSHCIRNLRAAWSAFKLSAINLLDVNFHKAGGVWQLTLMVG